MIKTFKAIALSVGVLAAASQTARAVGNFETLPMPPYAVSTISVQLTATYAFQDPAKVNAKNGTITDAKGQVTIPTPMFIQLLASNLGVTNLSKGATLIKVTQLVPGTNFVNVITNSPTNVPGTFLLETNIQYSYVFTNNSTNGAQYVTNLTDGTPTGYSYLYATNPMTNLIQATPATIMIASNTQYFINNGKGYDTNNFIPLGNRTNDNASASGSFGDSSVPGTMTYVYVDPASNYYVSQGFTSNFNLGMNFTNSHVFVGSIKTNLDVSGTLYNDTVHISIGPPRIPITDGTNLPSAPPQINISGTANANAADMNVGSGKTALPFAGWNATYPVTGSGTVGGMVTNYISTNNYTYLTTSNVEIISSNPNLSEPPYTNISTNLSTNYSVVNTTNSAFVITGHLTETFVKIVQQ